MLLQASCSSSLRDVDLRHLPLDSSAFAALAQALRRPSAVTLASLRVSSRGADSAAVAAMVWALASPAAGSRLSNLDVQVG